MSSGCHSFEITNSTLILFFIFFKHKWIHFLKSECFLQFSNCLPYNMAGQRTYLSLVNPPLCLEKLSCISNKNWQASQKATTFSITCVDSRSKLTCKDRFSIFHLFISLHTLMSWSAHKFLRTLLSIMKTEKLTEWKISKVVNYH